MKHAATRALFAYWDTCRGDREAPGRAEIEPAAIRHVLGDTFILTLDKAAGHPFRLAGTRICALFGGELKDTAFIDLWSDDSVGLVQELVTTAAKEMTGFVAGAQASTADGQALELEVLVLPLRRQRRMPQRLLGSLSAMHPPYWAGFKPLQILTLGHYRHLDSALRAAMPPRLRVPPERQPHDRHRFVVHEGGRRD